MPAPSAPVTATTSPARTHKIEACRARDQTNASHAQNDLAGQAGGRRARGVVQVSSDHRPDSSAEIERLRLVGDRAPVAQDHDAVGDAADVAKPMGDVEHADAAPAQPIDHAEKPIRLGSRQARSRLIEDQDASLGGYSSSNGDELAVRRTEYAEILVERRVKSDSVGDSSRLPGGTAL